MTFKEWWQSLPAEEKPGLFTLAIIVSGIIILGIGLKLGEVAYFISHLG